MGTHAAMHVTWRGAEVDKTPDVMKLVRRDLVVTPFSPQQAFPQSFRVYCESPSRVIVPLHWARKALAHLPATDTRAPVGKRHLEFVGTLRPELRQPDAAEAVLQAWQSTGGATLCLPTGYGKTTTSLYLACQAGCRTLILVHKDFLARQWEERIRQFVPAASITRVQGAECDTSGDFVIAMLQTLVSRKYPATTFAACGLVIVDGKVGGREGGWVGGHRVQLIGRPPRSPLPGAQSATTSLRRRSRRRCGACAPP